MRIWWGKNLWRQDNWKATPPCCSSLSLPRSIHLYLVFFIDRSYNIVYVISLLVTVVVSSDAFGVIKKIGAFFDQKTKTNLTHIQHMYNPQCTSCSHNGLQRTSLFVFFFNPSRHQCVSEIFSHLRMKSPQNQTKLWKVLFGNCWKQTHVAPVKSSCGAD